MAQQFESAAKSVSDGKLLLRGLVLLVVTGLIATALVAKSQNVFADRVDVTALLTNVGDGLPNNSDVKFRGVLVGVVDSIKPALDGGYNVVQLDINPHYAASVPASVTARVVPSNVFAVSSVQLIDNGPGPGLHPGAQIHQDDSLATVQFQTALTKLRDVVAAASRPGANGTVGVLAAVAEATERRGDELTHSAGGMRRITHELDALMAPDGSEPTLAVLSDALHGLQSSAPDLLNAVHDAVVPMRTIAEKRQELANFLSAGLTTFGTMGTAFENQTDRLIVITTQLSPVLGAIADGGKEFAPIVTRIKNVTDGFLREVWKPDRQIAQGKFMLVFTPNRLYTRQDCPRYGNLEGASCHTAPDVAEPPVLPPNLDPRNFPVAPEMSGGNVGTVGSPEERAKLDQLLGSDASPADQLLLGPVARGNTVQVVPDGPAPVLADPAAPAPLPAEAGGTP